MALQDSTHLKVSYAMAMPVGMTSQGEYLDVELTTSTDGERLKASLNEHAPKGLEILGVKIYEEPVKSQLSSVITEGIIKAKVPLAENITRRKGS